MRVIGIGLSALAVALAAPALIACGSEDQREHEGALGTLNLSLTGTSGSGAHYRLVTAKFAVSGGTNATLSSDTDPDAASLKKELPAGAYVVKLNAGWKLEKETDGVFAPIKAVLVSPNPQGFQIVDQAVTPVIFAFKAGEDVVELGNGLLDISISIDDGACPAGQTHCGAGCVDLNSDVDNCGACGNVCAGSDVCSSGVCTPEVLNFSGILTGLPVTELTGWSKCYDDAYGDPGSTFGIIQSECNQPRLLLGCRSLSNPDVLIVAANALREDVFFDVGTANVTHEANGVGWYFNNSWSWGFAPVGAMVQRSSCDVADPLDGQRLCWHTSADALAPGWRCGTNAGLNDSQEFRRVIYQAP